MSRKTPKSRRPVFARAFAALTALVFFASAALFPLRAGFAAAPEDDNLVDPTQRADNSFIYDTTIESLASQASIYDNRIVQVVGEVIGDRIVARNNGFCWITLTVIDAEDKTSMSVLISNEQANQIDRFGRYGITGTILQVRGTFHQACNEHDGLPDIHATDSSVMSSGVEHRDTFNISDFVPGIVTVLAGGALMAAFYAARERTR